jgi:acetyl-CoA acetyltransferase
MKSGFAAAGQVAIVGYAHSPATRDERMPLGALTIQTIRDAVGDAGLRMHDIDGFTTASAFVSSAGREVIDGVHSVSADWVVGQLGLEPRWLAGFQGIGQISGSVILATEALASGAVDYVVVHRALHNPRGSYHGNSMTHATGSAQWNAPQGLWGPPTYMALPYMRYQQKYGATRHDMAELVVSARQAGSVVPWSYWKDKPLTVDDYLASPMIADPMCVLDCDIPVNGVAAFILTTADRARDLPHRPVYVAGYGLGTRRSSNTLEDFSLENIIEGGKSTADRLWRSTGLVVGDVDVPQFYDGFAPLLYFWLEALGYCGEGEAYGFTKDPDVTAGMTFRTGGGAIGNGRMHGVSQMLECYLQLSKRAGARQLAAADVGFACQGLPHMGAVVAFTSAAD